MTSDRFRHYLSFPSRLLHEEQCCRCLLNFYLTEEIALEKEKNAS